MLAWTIEILCYINFTKKTYIRNKSLHENSILMCTLNVCCFFLCDLSKNRFINLIGHGSKTKNDRKKNLIFIKITINVCIYPMHVALFIYYQKRNQLINYYLHFVCDVYGSEFSWISTLNLGCVIFCVPFMTNPFLLTRIRFMSFMHAESFSVFFFMFEKEKKILSFSFYYKIDWMVR